MRRRHFILAALVAAPVLACADGGSEWAGTVRDSAGIAIVENPLEGVWAPGEAPTIELELDIGSAEGPAETQFGQIAPAAGIDVAENGDIYVLDMQASIVRVFDANGTYLREMGGQGSGPGELSQALGGVLLLPGDTVLVPDVLQQRLTRYTPTGNPVASVPLPLTEGIPIRWEKTADHRIIQQQRRMQLPGMDSVTQADYLIERGADGTIRDTIMQLPTGGTINFSGEGPMIRLFSPEPVWAIGTDSKVYYAINDGYSILVHSRDGVLERIIRRPFERRAVTESDQQQIRDAMTDMMRDQGVPPQAVAQMGQMLQFADYYPAFATIIGGPQGSIWVQQIRSAEEMAAGGGEFDIQDTGSNRFDVFDSQGRYLGVIELPQRFQPMRVVGSYVYGIWRDELDVQHVRRLRIGGTIEEVPSEIVR